MSGLRPVLAFLALACAILGGAQPSSAQAQQPQEAQARFAFVIGNDAYEGAPLATAANDAALVADALKAAKFDVMGARNLDQDTLRASYREFLAKVAGAGGNAVSVVYISGYGLQFDGENYLMPPGVTIARDADISLNGIRLSDLVRPLSGSPGRGRVILLDLAYNSPFAKQGQGLPPGLGLVEPAAGTIVGFNAAPGVWAAPGKAPYGPYAQALSEMLREPGLPIEEILARVRTRTAELTKGAQVPWSAGRIDPPVVLLERAPDAPAPAVEPAQVVAERAKPVDKLPEALAYSAVIDRDTIKGYEDFVAAYPQSPYTKNVRGLLAARREARTWRRTLDINTQNAYWSYLKRYPRGPHAAEARRRLTRLQAALEPPPSFDPVVYDDPPPPPVEEAYFDAPEVVFYDPDVPPLGPSIFVAAPPPWYQPPPPPVFDDDEDDFFLPEIVTVVSTPAWIVPPPYVLPPPVPYVLETRPPGWRPFVAIPAALAVGLAAGRLSNRFLDHRRANPGPQNQPPRPAIIPAISALPKGMSLPPGVRPGQPIPRPVSAPGGQPARPGQPGGIGGQPGVGGQPGIGRPNNALPSLPAGRPGQPGQPGTPGATTPITPLGARPGQPLLGRPGQPAQPGQPGQIGRPTGGQATGAPPSRPGARPGLPPGQPGQTGQPLDRRQQLIQQRQQQQDQRKLQLQQQQQQRAQQQQLRQQQMQEQRSRNQQMQQQRLQQLQQRRDAQQRQLQMNQQRGQQMQQMRQQQMERQRAIQQQQMQQRAVQQQRLQQMQQQRQQQMMQQRQQQQMMQQRQQMMMQQRQQQMMQQRQQQMILQQQRQQPQRRPCGAPGLPRC